MGANFGMVQTKNDGDTIYAADITAEFTNILTNLTPAGIDDESVSTAAMQARTDPYPAGVASLATSLQGEIQRLRYVIQQITKQTQWYMDPVMNQIGATTRAMTDASGDVDYTGLNFTPTGIIFLALVTNTPGLSIGFDNGTVHYCVYNNHIGIANAWTVQSTASIAIQPAEAAHSQTAFVKSFNSDGFTLTWAKSNDPTGTMTIYYLALP